MIFGRRAADGRRSVRPFACMALLLGALALQLLRVADPWPLERLRSLGFDALQGVGPLAENEAAPAPVLIGIGAPSLADPGPWPWPRDRLAALVDAASERGAAAVVLDMSLDAPGEPTAAQQPGAAETPSADRALAEALRHVRSALATSVTDTPAADQTRGPFALAVEGTLTTRLPSFEGVAAAAPPIRAMATTEGAASLSPEADGVVRRATAVFFAGGVAHPALPVAAVAALGQGGRVLAGDAGIAAIELGGRRIRTDAAGRFFIDFARGAARVARIEARDFMAPRREGSGAVAGRVVVIGVDAPGLAPSFPSAHGEPLTGPLFTAIAVDALLSGATLARPGVLATAEHIAFLATVIVLGFVWLRFPALAATVATVGAGLLWLAVAAALRMGGGLVVDAATPILLLGVFGLFAALTMATARRMTARNDGG